MIGFLGVMKARGSLLIGLVKNKELGKKIIFLILFMSFFNAELSINSLTFFFEFSSLSSSGGSLPIKPL